MALHSKLFLKTYIIKLNYLMQNEALVKQFKRLFPEESYLIGLNDNLAVDNEADFVDKLSAHLSFYERHYLPLQFEKFNKVGLLLSYHLLKHTPLSDNEISFINDITSAMPDRFKNITDELAYSFMLKTFYAYQTSSIVADVEKKKILFPKEIKSSATVFQNSVKDVSYELWQKNIYNLSIIPLNELYMEADSLLSRLSTLEKYDEEPVIDNFHFINSLVDVIKGINEELFSSLHVDVRETPKYLEQIYPTAAALTLDRLSNPRGIYFINPSARLNASDLVLITVHEVFGHIFQFQLANQFCKDRLKLLSYFMRFPLTEGFALLAEDFAVDIFKNKYSKLIDFMKGNNIKYDSFVKNLEYSNVRYRLLRYIRYIFESRIYLVSEEPDIVIQDLSLKYNFELENLRKGLYPFLFTPGYASTYIGGYEVIKKVGTFSDGASFFTKIGKFGLSGLT